MDPPTGRNSWKTAAAQARFPWFLPVRPEPLERWEAGSVGTPLDRRRARSGRSVMVYAKVGGVSLKVTVDSPIPNLILATATQSTAAEIKLIS